MDRGEQALMSALLRGLLARGLLSQSVYAQAEERVHAMDAPPVFFEEEGGHGPAQAPQ